MAVSGVSARDPYSISTMAESCEKELGVHPSGAGHPDGSDGWRILQPANAGEVRGAVRTPVAKEGNYCWLPIVVSDTWHGLNLTSHISYLELLNHGKDLLVFKSFQFNCAGAAGGHT
jgi:hypothetical protein